MSSKEIDTHTRILQATWELLESSPGRSLSMGEIAKASGISRQALYLHFSSRTELLIATTHYVDNVKGLEQRLEVVYSASDGEDMLRLFIKVWGEYIPEIYGVAKALMMSKDNDEAAAAAWLDVMGCLYDICGQIIKMLAKEGRLSPDWTQKQATDLLGTLISIQNWEHLTQECNWSNKHYLSNITQTLSNALLKK